MATAEELALGARIRALITAVLGSAVWEGGGGAGTPASQLDADGTVLDVNTIVDGEFLKRVGTTIVSAVAGGGGPPAAHHLTHENGGTDEITVAGLSGLLADAQTPLAHTHAAADIVSGLIALARLGAGVPDATKFLRGDQTWAVPAGGGGGLTNLDGGVPGSIYGGVLAIDGGTP